MCGRGFGQEFEVPAGSSSPDNPVTDRHDFFFLLKNNNNKEKKLALFSLSLVILALV